MSVQSEFFDALLKELIDRGIDTAVAESNVSKFREQLVSRAESEDQLNSALSKIPPASIAENIYNMIRSDEGDADAGAKSEVMVIDTDADTVETRVREGKDAVAPLSSESVSESSDEDDASENAAEDSNTQEEETAEETQEENEKDDSPAFVIVPEDADVHCGASDAEEEPAENGGVTEAAAADEDAEVSEEPEEAFSDSLDELDSVSDSKLDSIFNGSSDEGKEEQDSATDADLSETDDSEFSNENTESFTLPGEDEVSELSKYSPGAKRRVHSVAQTPPGERKTVRRASEAVDLFLDDDESKNNWLFIIMAIVIIPIAFILGAAIFLFFVLLWLALAVVITLLLVGLVGIVGAGTAVSLAGLIFGIIESISGYTAAGMFEIGLALIVGALVMFAGIWLYNFAVRFIPFIIKKLGVLLIKIFSLFKKSFRKIKELTSRI